MRGFLTLLLVLILIGCTPNPASTAYPGLAVAPSVTATETESPEQQTPIHPTLTLPRKTPVVTTTPSPFLIQAPEQTIPAPTLQAMRTLEAYRSSCPDLVYNQALSPSGEWLYHICFYSQEDGNYIALHVFQPANLTEWKVAYRQGSLPWDQGNFTSEIGLRPVHWSPSEVFLYFSLYRRGDGPRGYFQSGETLQRLDLQTGTVTQVLSASPVQNKFYTFDFSSTGRWLAYTFSDSPKSIHLLNMVTGEEKNISLAGEWSIVGRFTWSPDGEWLTFVAATFPDVTAGLYSIGVISTKTFQSQMVLQDVGSPSIYNRWEDGKLVISWEDTSQTTNKSTEHTVWFDPNTGETESKEPLE